MAASASMGLYLLHDFLHASFTFFTGWLADRFDNRHVLAAGYALAFLRALVILVLPLNRCIPPSFSSSAESTSRPRSPSRPPLCAELVAEAQHGMAFGTLATVNGVGDFASSVVVGFLWTFLGTGAAFGCSALLFLSGAWMVWRIRPAARAVS